MNRKVLWLSLAIVLIGVGSLIGFFKAQEDIEKDKENLQAKIDDLFQGKDAVVDGEKMMFTGAFVDEDEMHYKYFSGGFTVVELSQESDGIVKTISTSEDLKFKEPARTWVPAQYINDYGWGRHKIMEGHYRDNFRPTVQRCYDGAYEFLLKGNEDYINPYYTPNTYVEIKNFPTGFFGNYHWYSQSMHPSEFYETQTVTGGRVYTAAYEQENLQKKSYFKVMTDSDAIQEHVIKCAGFGGGLGLAASLVLMLLIKVIKRTPDASSPLFNTNWRNVDDGLVLRVDPKSFGKYSAVLIKGHSRYEGSAELQEGGSQLRLSFSNEEYFYEILEVTSVSLELLDLTTSSKVKFEKLGSSKQSGTENAESQVN